MLMLCVLYCVPLVKLLYFVSGPFMVLCGAFALKRGIRTRRKGLRQIAFCLMFFGALKPLMIDVHMQIAQDFVCGIGDEGERAAWCTDHAVRMAQVGGLFAFAAFSVFLMWLSIKYMPDRKVKALKPEDVSLGFWANFGLWSVIFLACWSLAPWVAALTVGHVPDIFSKLTWQEISAFDTAILLFGFWRMESCSWEYKVADKKDRRSMSTRTWTPKDTLWMSVLLFLLTMGMSRISQDALTPKDPMKQHAGPSFDHIESMLPKTAPPDGMNTHDTSNPFAQ